MPPTRATGTIGIRDTQRRIISPRWRATATPHCTGGRSGHRRCLIPSTDFHKPKVPTDPDTDLRNAQNLLQQGQLEEAVRTYVQLADDYWLEEKYADADVVYKKALEADRNHDHVLWQLSDIAARHGRPAEARQYLAHLIDLRTLRGDDQGLAECHKRLQAIEAAAGAAPAPAPGSEIDLSDALADMGGEQ